MAIVDATTLQGLDPETEYPANPDTPGVPFPPIADDAHDAELEAIAAARALPAVRALLVVRILSIVAAAVLAFALRHDLRYALSPRSVIELPANASTAELSAHAHRWVALKGIPGGVGAVDYRRPLQIGGKGGMYRLGPLVDRPDVLVEVRLPDGVDPARFVPPTSLSGRLVPLDEAGVRFGDARTLLERATGRAVPANAFLLESGAEPTPRAPAAMLAGFALLVLVVQSALWIAQRRRTAG
jgi:hypothetical protein